MTIEKVDFRMDDEHGECVAFFPGQDANRGMIVSYAHIGQHSEASLGYMIDLRRATESERADLLAEIRQIYDDCTLAIAGVDYDRSR